MWSFGMWSFGVFSCCCVDCVTGHRSVLYYVEMKPDAEQMPQLFLIVMNYAEYAET
jgi:hypothetical protein